MDSVSGEPLSLLRRMQIAQSDQLAVGRSYQRPHCWGQSRRFLLAYPKISPHSLKADSLIRVPRDFKKPNNRLHGRPHHTCPWKASQNMRTFLRFEPDTEKLGKETGTRVRAAHLSDVHVAVLEVLGRGLRQPGRAARPAVLHIPAKERRDLLLNRRLTVGQLGRDTYAREQGSRHQFRTRMNVLAEGTT